MRNFLNLLNCVSCKAIKSEYVNNFRNTISTPLLTVKDKQGTLAKSSLSFDVVINEINRIFL